MRTRLRNLFISSIITLVAILLTTNARAADLPLGTSFTYQGRLYDGMTAASGLHDFLFTLRDEPSGNSLVNTTPYPNPVALTVWVTNGLFTTNLDFGTNPFTGPARWLEISVRPANDNLASFETLAPRQELKPTPYAMFASNAAVAMRAISADSAGGVPWSGITGVPPGFADGVDNDHIYTAGAGLTLSGSDFSVNFAGTGLENSVARSDHGHFGQIWTGNSQAGLVVNNQSSALAAFALHGRTAITTPGGQSAAVRGENAGTANLGFGVWGSHAADGIGVFGEAAGGKGVLGSSSATTGTGMGVQGLSYSPTGIGVSGRHESASGTAAGVLGETASVVDSAVGVQGTVVSPAPGGTSSGVRGVNNGTGTNGIGVYGSQAGSGWGVYGETPTGIGVYGLHASVAGHEPGVLGATSSSGDGVGVLGQVSASGGMGSAAVRGENLASNGGVGVQGMSANNGTGVMGETLAGVGVWGSASGTNGFNVGVTGATMSPAGYGVHASGSGATGTALAIETGGIRILGAGVESSTPVFIHRATAATTSGHITTIDHPLANGDPNAILLVTHNFSADISTTPYEPNTWGVWYNGSKWTIFHENTSVAMPVGRAFNVMIIKP